LDHILLFKKKSNHVKNLTQFFINNTTQNKINHIIIVFMQINLKPIHNSAKTVNLFVI